MKGKNKITGERPALAAGAARHDIATRWQPRRQEPNDFARCRPPQPSAACHNSIDRDDRPTKIDHMKTLLEAARVPHGSPPLYKSVVKQSFARKSRTGAKPYRFFPWATVSWIYEWPVNGRVDMTWTLKSGRTLVYRYIMTDDLTARTLASRVNTPYAWGPGNGGILFNKSVRATLVDFVVTG